MKFQGRIQAGSLARVQRELVKSTGRAYPLLRREFENWGIDWEQRMVARFAGATGTGTLRSRSGDLRRSLQKRVNGTSLDDLRLRLTSDGISYARIQEFGGEVKPVRAQYLTIPVLGNVLPTGLARFPTAASLEREYGSRTTFFRSRSGALFLGVRGVQSGRAYDTGGTAAPRAKRGGLAAFFVLKKGVRIPARLGFHKTWNDLAPSRQVGLAAVARQIGRG